MDYKACIITAICCVSVCFFCVLFFAPLLENDAQYVKLTDYLSDPTLSFVCVCFVPMFSPLRIARVWKNTHKRSLLRVFALFYTLSFLHNFYPSLWLCNVLVKPREGAGKQKMKTVSQHNDNTHIYVYCGLFLCVNERTNERTNERMVAGGSFASITL